MNIINLPVKQENNILEENKKYCCECYPINFIIGLTYNELNEIIDHFFAIPYYESFAFMKNNIIFNI